MRIKKMRESITENFKKFPGIEGHEFLDIKGHQVSQHN